MKRPLEFVINEAGCFICTSHSSTSSGSVHVMSNGKRVGAHRLVFEEMFGEIPEKHFIRFDCGTAGCLNPEHLSQGLSASHKKIEFEVDKNNCFNSISRTIGKYGYPLHKKNRFSENLHRYIYREMFGEIPEGHVIRHKCDNRKCINPEHLESGTISENSKDMFERGRNPKGEKHGMAILKEVQVIEIFRMLDSGWTTREIMNAFNIGSHVVYSIKNGKTWKHLGLVPARESN